MNKDLLILDTETTGLNKDQPDEPVSIAVIDINGNVLFNRRIKPTVEIDPGASAIHGITAADLTDAPSFADVWPELEAVLHGKTICVFNAGYDSRILANAAAAHGLKFPQYQFRCVMREYAKAYGEPGNYGSPKWQKLTNAYQQQFQKAFELPAHDALSDCLMTLELLKLLDGDGLKAVWK